MQIAVDTHVHLYSFYNVPALLAAAYRNLKQAAPAAQLHALCLTERSGVYQFESLMNGAQKVPGWTIEASPDASAVWARPVEGGALLLLAGRQIITAERLEVLALGADLRIEDGQPAREMIRQIHDARALAVLPWGLGKWMGERGRWLQHLLSESAPDDFALGDTYLLPALARRPALLRKAESRGFRILAGTDPLGRAGEEQLVGRYGVQADAAFDSAAPGPSLLNILRNPSIPLSSIGRRGSLLETLKRMR